MVILSKFSERLSELMFEHNMTASNLAKQLGIPPSTITRYIKGDCLPSFRSFVALIEIFNCSADFLVGKTDSPNTEREYRQVQAFDKRFKELLKEYNFSQYALHKKTNFSYDNFNKWLKGTTAPYLDNLLKLADAFDCSIDYLLGREI